MPPSYQSASGFISGARDLPPWLVAAYVRGAAGDLGATETTVLLQDFGQTALIPLSDESVGEAATGALSIEGTMAGRAYASMTVLEVHDEASCRLFLPLIDGGDRIGVLIVKTDEVDAASRARWEEFAAAAAALIGVKGRYTDVYFRARRRAEMSLAAEMQWHLMPPLNVTDPRISLAGLVEPAYEVGGDAFDYAINHETAHFAVFDAMGHGIDAAVMAGVAVAAYRHARRGSRPIQDLYTLMDRDFARQFGGDRFVTAQLVNLHLPTGRLSMVNAGHPAPLHIRGRKVIGTIDGARTLPVGLGGAPPKVLTADLEPGDRLLLYTDGVVDSRRGGETYGEEHLAADVELVLTDPIPGPEILRRLNHRQSEWRAADPTDDCSLVLAEWRSKELPPV